MSYQVVIAKYKENIDWTNTVENVKIYNKGPDGDIPNIGREGETFLRYIIEHYEVLPDFVVFLQGDPFPHMPPSVNKDTIGYQIKNKQLNKPIEPCFGIWASEVVHTFPGLNTDQYYKFFFKKDLENDTIRYVPGCQYFIKREAILKNSKEFYINLKNMLVKGSEKYERYHDKTHRGPNNFDTSEINGWTLERLWPHFFL